VIYKRGKVREVDGKTGRARVEFEDRDKLSSFWLHVNQPLASGKASRVYVMPEQDSFVNCVVDEGTEDGTIIGATYNDEDKVPSQDPSHIVFDLGGGLKLDYDKGAGKLTLAVPNGITLSVGGTVLDLKPGEVKLDSAKFTANAPTEFPKGHYPPD